MTLLIAAGIALAVFLATLKGYKLYLGDPGGKIVDLTKKCLGLEAERDYWESRFRSRDQYANNLEKFNSELKAIAETHKVEWPFEVKEPTPVTVWDDRKFFVTIDNALETIRSELEKIEHAGDLIVDVMIKWHPGLSAVFKAHFPDSYREDYHKLKVHYRFQGSSTKVCNELATVFDDPIRMFKVERKGNMLWSFDENAALTFVVSVVKMVEPTLPVVHTVEVLKLQEVIKEVVIEKVVYHDCDHDKAPPMNVDVLADPDIKALIEIAVEEAVARRLGPGVNQSLAQIREKRALVASQE